MYGLLTQYRFMTYALPQCDKLRSVRYLTVNAIPIYRSDNNTVCDVAYVQTKTNTATSNKYGLCDWVQSTSKLWSIQSVTYAQTMKNKSLFGVQVQTDMIDNLLNIFYYGLSLRTNYEKYERGSENTLTTDKDGISGSDVCQSLNVRFCGWCWKWYDHRRYQLLRGVNE